MTSTKPTLHLVYDFPISYIEETRNMYNILDGKPNRRCHLEDLGLHVKMILKYVFLRTGQRIYFLR
jgi:hypothetical protein